jgi:rod shape-determining protein MreD
MSRRAVAISLGLVFVAVIIQTTLFGDGRVQPFGASPLLVPLVVMACVRYLEPEPALLLGFTGGLLLDLLGGSPLGLWAMVNVVVAYVGLRLRARADDGVLVVAFGVFAVSLLAQGLFLLAGTLFGQRLFATSGIVKLLLLPALYTTLLAAGVFPAVTWLLRERTVGTWLR